MTTKEIRQKNSTELQVSLSELRNKLTKMRHDISGKQAKNHRELRKIKKEIARIMTVLSEKTNDQE